VGHFWSATDDGTSRATAANPRALDWLDQETELHHEDGILLAVGAKLVYASD
jgi:hypothetical protein